MTRNRDGHICQYYGPHQGAANDLNVLYESTLSHQRKECEWWLGDGLFFCMYFVPIKH